MGPSFSLKEENVSRNAKNVERVPSRPSRRRVLKIFQFTVLMTLAVVVAVILVNRESSPVLTYPAISPSPIGLARPVIPPFPKPKPGQDPLRARFEHMLAHSPDKETRDGVIRANKEENLLIGITKKSGFIASFSVEPRETPASINNELGRRPLVARLAISSEALESITTSEEMLRFLASVGHEYLHFQQWVATPSERWSSDWARRPPGTHLTPDECRRQFQQELPGHRYGCGLLIVWQVVPSDDRGKMCLMLGDKRAFARTLVRSLQSSVQGAEHPECVQYWSEVADRQGP